jgi:F-type H+-transporting ATPase subunit b
MQIDWWTLGLQTFNALVLIWILSRFLFRPVSDIMRKRQEAVAKIIAEATAAKAAASAAEAKADAEAVKLAAERGAVLDKAVAEAKSARQSILAEAQAEVAKMKTDAKSAIDGVKKKKDADAALHASRLAAELAAKLLSRLPESALVDGFVDGLAEGIAALPEETRKGMCADGKSMTLVAARALTPEEEKKCAAMLETALNVSVPSLAVKVDRGVIAGLELEAEHALVRNSFRADLERILAEMMRHE